MLLGGTGGIAGCLAGDGHTAIAVALLAGAVALIVAAYWSAARPGGTAIEGTTEVAALVVVALGALSGLGQLQAASGAIAIVVLALSEKERLQSAVNRIGEATLTAALRFAVLALVVLPLLPDESYGPLGGFQPRALWTIVLIFSGINFAGYLAREAIGAQRGYGITGLFGGLISSTAVTLSFSRLSKTKPALAKGLALGTVAASTMLPLRVTAVCLVLNATVALVAVKYLWPSLVAGAAFVAYFLLRRPETAATGAKDGEKSKSPLGLWSALKMAVAFQFVLMAITWVRERFDTAGVQASAALLGVADVDALVLSMARTGRDPEFVPLAAQAIAIGAVANTALKLTIAAVFGSNAYRAIALPGLALLGLGIGVAMWLAG
jgi:uncharacterized membrane protein (DUF4010 family)